MDKEIQSLIIKNRSRILFGLASSLCDEKRRLEALEIDPDKDFKNIEDAREEIQYLFELMNKLAKGIPDDDDLSND